MNTPQLAQAIYDALPVKMSFADITPAVERLNTWKGVEPIRDALMQIVQENERLKAELNLLTQDYKTLAAEHREVQWRMEQLEK